MKENQTYRKILIPRPSDWLSIDFFDAAFESELNFEILEPKFQAKLFTLE